MKIEYIYRTIQHFCFSLMKRRLVAKVLDIFKAMPDLLHFYFQVIYDRTSCRRDENPNPPDGFVLRSLRF